MRRVLYIVISLIILFAFAIPVFASTSQVIPTFNILAVVRDQSVTIQTANFPANDTFTVTMGKIGTRGVGGVTVETTQSGNGGSFQATYKIPASLSGSEQISIRLQSPSSGFFAYNWFWNNTATVTLPPPTTSTATPSPTIVPTPTSTPSTTPVASTNFPAFSIVSVVMDQTVTIKGVNFPANDTFEVFMGEFGTRGVDGISVGSTDTGAGGSLSATYNIPASLAGSSMIAIRLESPTSGFFAYNWFWNNTAP